MARNEKNRTHSGEQLAWQEENKEKKPLISARTIEIAEKKREARKNRQTELNNQLKKEIKSKIKKTKDYGLKMSAKRSTNLSETTNQSYFLKR